jgi:hypothetical protein
MSWRLLNISAICWKGVPSPSSRTTGHWLGALSRRSDPWSGRQQRHLSFIAEYSPTIRHIASQLNVVADTLSRPASGTLAASSPTESEGQCSPPAGGKVADQGKSAPRVLSPFLCLQVGSGGVSSGFFSICLTSSGSGGVSGGAAVVLRLPAGSFFLCSQGDHHSD